MKIFRLFVAFTLICFALSPVAHATPTITVLHTFTSSPDGAHPDAGVIMDGSGNLYGTTTKGGFQSQHGTVFKIDADGFETVLHGFAGRPDGVDPEAGLFIDGDGNLYGTTQTGGSQGKGTVFKIDSGGTETILHSFTNNPADGTNPVAALVRGPDGNLYGTASNGGDQTQNGTVFKIDPSTGTVTLLNVFNGNDARNPLGGVFFDMHGNLYGTTYQGGIQNQGTVFEIDTTGNFHILYIFGELGGVDGKWPRAGVIMDQSGNLLGTTSMGGAYHGGIVFKIDSHGNETVLHSFGALGDGQFPYGGLAIDANGNLYGTTLYGGDNQLGTVFEIDNAGNYSVLHSFQQNDGANPAAGVIVGGDGSLYGTTTLGGFPPLGMSAHGTVFKLSLN